MQMSTSPMTQFWSTDSAPMQTAFTQSNMQMHEVKAEAVPCLQVGFALYKHMHTSTLHHTTLCIAPVNIIELHLLIDRTAVLIDQK